MGRCLFTVWPIPGHYNPALALAHALAERGNTVAFYTGNRARAVVEREGFEVLPFARVDEEYVDRLLFDGTDAPRWRQLAAQRRRLRRWLTGMLREQVEDLTVVLREWQPDVIVCDVSMWGPHVVLAETHDVPVVIFQFQAGCLLPGPGAPPAGFGLAPPRTRAARGMVAAVRALSALATRGLREDANQVRAAYRLPPLSGSVMAHAAEMPLYLVTSAPELDYERRDLPACVQYIGPCHWDRPQSETPPAWLSQLGLRPVVHVTEGTIHARKPFLLAAASAGLAERDVDVIMTTGRHRHPSALGFDRLPSNVRLEPWIAHSVLFSRTDVVVTTGGAGTVLAALAAGIPLLVVPTEWDKPESARRVEQAGAGLMLPPHRCTPDRVRAAVEQLLDDRRFRRNAARVGAALRRCGGAPRAAKLIEQHTRHRYDTAPSQSRSVEMTT